MAGIGSMFVLILLQSCYLVVTSVMASARTAPQADSSSSGGCFYSFQVWRPNQDVLSKLRHLEDHCTNLTSHLDHQVALLKSQLLSETLMARNLSHSLERDIMEQKMVRLQQDVLSKDLQLQLVQVKAEQRKLWNRMKAHPVAGHHDGNIQNMEEMVNQLKNGVGDLKAEWLLIKRDVQDIRSLTQHEGTAAKPNELNDMVQALKDETNRLHEKQVQILEVQEKLQESVQAGKLQGMSDDKGDRLQEHLKALQVMTKRLQADLRTLEQHHHSLSQQILAVVIATTNASKDDLMTWVKKFKPIVTEKETSKVPRDCHDVYQSGRHISGVYQIQPEHYPHPESVYCQMINSTGWTVFQRRVDGTISFNRRWLEYKYGFGSPYGEYWWGNELIHRLSSQSQYRLRVDLWDWEGNVAYAEYNDFRVQGEDKQYTMHVQGYHGNAGDSLSIHDGMAFSTEDSDNDLFMRHCAEENKGGWWFNSCYSAHLNGVYHTGWYVQAAHSPYSDGIVWYTHKGSEVYSLRKVEMKLSPYYL